MTVTTINVTDMHCASCSSKIRDILKPYAEIQRLQFNPVRKQIYVTHADTLTSATLLEQIEAAGFHPELRSDSRLVLEQSHGMLKRLGVAGLAMMQVMMVQIALYAGAMQGIEESIRRLLEFTALLFSIPVVVYSATPFFDSAFRALRRGVNMDVPIALAIGIAFAVSLSSTLRGSGEVYYDSVVMFTFLMLGARYLEQRLRHRLSVEDALQAALPRVATLIDAGVRVARRVDEISVDDLLWIAEGDQIPLDGTVASTSALVEEALLTGENDWRERRRGEQVFAGTLNRGAGFRLRVNARLEDSRLAEINKLANTALDAKHDLARLADKVARVFVPAILLIAAITYLIWSWYAPARALSAALAVLVVSCPCALSLATPAALTAALTRLRQAGVLVNNSRALEIAGRLVHVYFDKTGTLTSPRTHIAATTITGRCSADECWHYATALQAHSAHPLAQAFRDPDAAPAQQVTLHSGRGLQGYVDGRLISIGSAEFSGARAAEPDGAKRVYLSVDNEPAASYTLANEMRPDAPAAIAALRKQGLAVSMLSGDNEASCLALAEQVGIDYIAESLPEAKPEILRGAKDTEGAVMYVGDGVNDLPALACADISAATLETTDLVKSKADVLLLTTRLGALCDFLRVAKRSRRIMTENLSWAVAYNLIAIPLAALGYAPPWAAALGMSLSSLLVMLNATRILRTPLEMHQPWKF